MMEICDITYYARRISLLQSVKSVLGWKDERNSKKLRNTAGIKSVKVSYSAGAAEIVYDTDIISLKDICAIIEKLGYQAQAEGGRS